MYLSIECSQQSLKTTIIDPESGIVLHQKSIDFDEAMPHRNTTDGAVKGERVGESIADPQMWVEALDSILEILSNDDDVDMAAISAITGSAIHSIIYLDNAFPDRLSHLNPALPLIDQIRPHYLSRQSPLLRHDTSANDCAEAIKTDYNSPDGIRSITGIPLSSKTGAAQIKKVAEDSNMDWDKVSHIHVTSSFLSSLLIGESAPIDETDTSQLCLYNIHDRYWHESLVSIVAPDLAEKLPLVTDSPCAVVGTISDYFCHKYGFSPQAVCLSWISHGAAYALGNGIVNSGDASFVLRDRYKHTLATKHIPTEIPSLAKVTIHPINGYLAHMILENGVQSFKDTMKRLNISLDEIDAQLEELPNSSQLPSLPFIKPEKALLINQVSQKNTTLLSFVTGQFLHIKLYSYWIEQKPSHLIVTGEAASLRPIRQICANIFQVPAIHSNDTDAIPRAHAIMIDVENEVSRIAIKNKYITGLALNTEEPEPYMANVYKNQLNHYHHLLYDHINDKSEAFQL